MQKIASLKDMPRELSGERPSIAIEGWKRKFEEEGEVGEASPKKKCKDSSDEENEYYHDKQESPE